MQEKYNHKEIEQKWQKIWVDNDVSKIDKDDTKNKYYVLDMFPYPSGDGLHMGHTESYTASDVFYRFKKMQGFNVLHPQGFDAFGLPAENFALKTGVHPAETTKKNMANYVRQWKSLGMGHDLENLVVTSDPKYYKWTQWIFEQFYKNDLVYQDTQKANWCSSCQTVIANEQVLGGECERCGTKIEQKEIPGWFFKITDFADDLIDGLDKVDWPEHTKKNQKNWIGKSEGAKIKFPVVFARNGAERNDVAIQNKNTNVIIIHGCPSDEQKAMDSERRTYDKGWLPWIKNELEKKDIKVDFPLMPHPWCPNYEDHKKEFEKLEINEDSIFIGTSCGTSFLLRWLGETKQKIKTLVLVAPWYEPKLDTEEGLDFYTFDIDESVKDRVKDIIIFTSDDEGEIGKESAKIFGKKLNAKTIEIKGYGHYMEKHMGTNEFPELLDEILKTKNSKLETAVEVFTTRPDTLFGATYMVLAPEHKLVSELKEQITNWDEVNKYIEQTKSKTEMERLENKEKTGVKLEGISAINPAIARSEGFRDNKEEVPIFIADYVLASYGTGAIMAVPGHDERDYEFAKKYDLPVNYVVSPLRICPVNTPKNGKETVERDNVHVLLVDSKNKKVACLHHKEHPWITFIIGGKKDGESDIETAEREVYEETGFKNIKFVKYLNSVPVVAEYYAAHKNHNKKVKTYGMVFELENDEKDEIVEEEKAKHEIVWHPFEKSTLEKTIDPCAELDIWMSGLDSDDHCYSEEGVLVNSGDFDGLSSEEAKQKITEFVGGELTSTYRLRDWSISRQRYWGCPIPIAYSPEGEAKLVPEEHLPWTLPTDVDFKPTGVSPLSESKELKERVEKIFGKGWTPEYDTMDTFVDSAWYFLRYPDVQNEEEFCSEARKKWLPPELYIGGAEHTYMHLLFARFFTKAMHKIGLIDFDEPFPRLRHQGMVLDGEGKKMSKSKGNVVNPDDMVERFGADSVRTYMLFAAPLEDEVMWNEDNIVGVYRFLEKVWSIKDELKEKSSEEVVRELHKTISRMAKDIEDLAYNTAVSDMMKFVNVVKKSEISKEDYQTFLKLLSPFAPHITQELWEQLENGGLIQDESFPESNESLAKDNTHTIALQVNGKVRSEMEIADGTSEDEVKKLGLEDEIVKKWVAGEEPKMMIYVENKLLNIVV